MIITSTLLLVALQTSAAAPQPEPVLGAPAVPAPTRLPSWQLAWADEFDGTSLGASWEHMLGDGQLYGLPAGWGNSELQYYTDSPSNSFVGGGALHIVVREEQVAGYGYTSARLRTLNRQDFLYGRIEARIQLPGTKGMWPAFWMLPSDDAYGAWAASGEIDIVEAQMRDVPKQLIQALHYGGTWPDNLSTVYYHSEGNGPNAVDFSQGYHTFAVEWEPTEIRWYVDGVQTFATSSWSSSGGPYPAPFDQPFHLLLNVAVGGAAPAPGSGSVFPQEMLIDWVRVYEDVAAPGGTLAHVESVEALAVSGGGPWTRGQASVLVLDENGNPVEGASVTGDFSGTFAEPGVSAVTDASGTALFETAGRTQGSASVDFCVSDVTHASLDYDPSSNAPGTSCGVAPPGTQSHVESISVSTQGGGPNKRGRASVIIRDENGSPVAGATVSGTFTGTYGESTAAVTDASGMAELVTSGTNSNPSFQFCVDDVVHPSLVYDAAANVVTCSSY